MTDPDTEPTAESEATHETDRPTGEEADEEREAHGQAVDDVDDESPSRRPTGEEASDGSPGAGTDRGSGVRKIVYWAVLGGALLFGGMMVLLVYSDVSTLINVFVAREYQLLIRTAFHLVLVLCAAIGVSLLVRRIEELPG